MNGNDKDDNEYWEKQERQTRELRESLPEDFKAYTAKKVLDYLDSLSPEDKNIWVDRIGNDPILQRVIYYVDSPPEEIDIRQRMLSKGDIDVEFDIKYVCFVQGQPEINRQEFLNTYLRKLSEKFTRVLTADIQKKTGNNDSIEVLRENCLKIEKTDGGRKTILDHSPFTRYELLKTPKKKIMTICALDDSDIGSRFNVDPFLIGWMQAFDQPDVRDEAYSDKLKMEIVDQHGVLIDPPKGFTNPFFFSLRERYEPLLKKEYHRWRSTGVIEYADIESCFFIVLKKSLGFVNPKSLYWKIRDLYRERIENPKVERQGDLIDGYPSDSDTLQSFLNQEVIGEALANKRFMGLILSDKAKTGAERKYIQRVKNKLKKK